MKDDKKSELFTQRAHRVAVLSDKVLGAPSEIDLAEAEDLLRAGNIDPQALKARLHSRFDAVAKNYSQKGQRVPPLLKQALADFRPGLSYSRAERELAREAQRSIRQLLNQVKQIAQHLSKQPSLTLATAFRSKKELSEQDKRILDKVVEDLQSRLNRGRRSKPPHD